RGLGTSEASAVRGVVRVSMPPRRGVGHSVHGRKRNKRSGTRWEPLVTSLLEPCAGKLARTVPRGGKAERPYLSQRYHQRGTRDGLPGGTPQRGRKTGNLSA